jgi:hypothetical protein
MTSPLRKSLERLVAFDAIAADDEALNRGIGHVEINKPGIGTLDTEYFDDGAEWENARLAPVIAALLDCVDALERIADQCGDEYSGFSVETSEEALAALRRLVGE